MLKPRPFQIVQCFALAFAIWMAFVAWESSRLSEQYEPHTADNRDSSRDLPQSANLGNSPEQQPNNQHEEGTESWPAIWGIRLKITDTLLVIFTAILAIYTARLWKSTAGLVTGGERQEHHFQSSERAFLELSHTSPGVTFTDGQPTVELKILNVGNTPCHVNDSIIGFGYFSEPKDGRLPRPNYKAFLRPTANQGYLVPNGYMFVSPRFAKDTTWPMDEIGRGELILVVCGYVEYTDVFGKVHHAGWGRYYEPGNENSPTGNLSYIPSKDYNYDRPKGV